MGWLKKLLGMEESESKQQPTSGSPANSGMSNPSLTFDDSVALDKDEFDQMADSEEGVTMPESEAVPTSTVPVSQFDNLMELFQSSKKDIFMHSSQNSGDYERISENLFGISLLRDTSITQDNLADQLPIMLLQYQKTLDACTRYEDSHKRPHSSSGKARLALVKNVRGFLETEFTSIKDAGAQVATGPKTWNEIIADSRTRKISKSSTEVGLKGNAGRERITLSEGGQDYFFTKKIGLLNQGDVARKVASKTGTPYDEIFVRYCDCTQNESYDRDVNKDMNMGKNVIMGDYYDMVRQDATFPTPQSRIQHLLGAFPSLTRLLNRIADQLNKENPSYTARPDFNDPKFVQAFDDFFIKATQKFTGGIDAIGAGIFEYGDNISKRNVAMSRVADLLGIGSILARSTIATLSLDGGEAEKGNLMEKAKGKDIGGLFAAPKPKTQVADPDDMFGGDFEEGDGASSTVSAHPDYDVSSPLMQKQAVQLQLLDAVCAQRDRHLGNIFFDFNGQGGFQGLQGIDNDGSFSSKDTDLNAAAGDRLDPVKISNEGQANQDFSLPVVDQDVAERILGLSKELLEYTLSDILKQKDIDATWERVVQLKQYLSKLKATKTDTFNPFVSDGEWGEETRRKLLYADAYISPDTTNRGKDKETGEDHIYRRTYYGRMASMIGQKIDARGFGGL